MIQQIIDNFKSWLPKANAVYTETLEREMRKAEEIMRQQFQQELEAQEARQRVLKSARI